VRPTRTTSAIVVSEKPRSLVQLTIARSSRSRWRWCQLKPLQRSDYYPVQFSEEQWAALQRTWPTGVCDFSKPGVSQTGPSGGGPMRTTAPAVP